MTTHKRQTRPDAEGDVAVGIRPETQKPRRYKVVFHNDDYTTQEFVVRVLIELFHKDEVEAHRLMLDVHHRGHATVGVFTRDVAETKAAQVMDHARLEGHPLKCTAEPEDGTGAERGEP